MIFDKLCMFVERGLPPDQARELSRGLREAAVFKVNEADVRSACGVTHKDDVEFPRRMFLPFDWTWIETEDYGCLLTTDTGTVMEKGDFFKEVVGDEGDPYTSVPEMYQVTVSTSSMGVLIVFGALIPFRNLDGRFSFKCAAASVGVINRGNICKLRGVHSAFGQLTDRESDALQQQMSHGPQALQLVNSPGNWIVKRENVTARPVQKGRVPRSDQRPRYIVVSDKEIERVIRDPNPANVGTVRPHRRRAHSHLLKSERFTWKRGQRVFVKACWVGPETAEYGGERYSVCLDL